MGARVIRFSKAVIPALQPDGIRQDSPAKHTVRLQKLGSTSPSKQVLVFKAISPEPSFRSPENV